MRKLLILLPIFLGASCASDKETAAPASTGRKSMEERFNSGPRTIAKDKNGEYPADVKKEFSLDGGRESAYFKGKSDMAKTYKTGEYAKTTWWGKKDYGRKPYEGNTDASRFQTAARDQGVTAREASNAARLPGPYQTGTYQTNAAREAGKDPYKTSADAEIEGKHAYPEQDVIGWKQLRAMDIKTTRSILGREQ
jgi:hypothetical protein